jgi:hypothetical protein
MNALDNVNLEALIGHLNKANYFGAFKAAKVITKLSDENARLRQCIDELEEISLSFQNASIDLAKQVAFLECWRDTWSPFVNGIKQSEPVAECLSDGEGGVFYKTLSSKAPIGKLYTTPQTKPEGYGKAVPLSNDEIREIGDECELKNNGILNWIEFAKAIEAKVKEGK